MTKKIPFAVCIIVWAAVILLGSAIIPLNLFVMQLPEFTSVIAVILGAAALGFIFFSGNAGAFSKALTTAFTVIYAAFVLFGSYCNPYWNSVTLRSGPYSAENDAVFTYEQAKADLDYMVRYVVKDHPMFMEFIPENFSEAYGNEIRVLLNDDEITTADIFRSAERILSVLGDAHTMAYTTGSENHYMKYVAKYNDMDAKFTGLNGKTLEEMLEEKSDLFSYEVESWGISMLKNMISCREKLELLGYNTDEGVTYDYVLPDGTVESVTAYTEDYLLYEDYLKFNTIGQEEIPTAFVYYSIDEDRSLALLTLNSCVDNAEYRETLKKMFTEVKEKGIKNVAVDLRDNGGGDSSVANEFIRYLNVDEYAMDKYYMRLGVFTLPFDDNVVKNQKYDELVFEGNVYLLVSDSSFSSAMMFAEYIKDNSLGTLIGEAPGNTPTGYGDIAVFRLPESGVYFQVSTRTFVRADSTTTDELVSPDIPCDANNAPEELYKAVA